MFTRLTKQQAKKTYNKGGEIILTSSKVSPASMFACYLNPFENLYGTDFEKILTQFKYWNCNDELGNAIHYWIKNNG